MEPGSHGHSIGHSKNVLLKDRSEMGPQSVFTRALKCWYLGILGPANPSKRSLKGPPTTEQGTGIAGTELMSQFPNIKFPIGAIRGSDTTHSGNLKYSW